MDIVRDEGAKLCAVNNKKAYFAMCRATLLLFVFVVISRFLEYGITLLFVDNSMIAEGMVAKGFSVLGLSQGEAVVAAKNFVNSVAVMEFINLVATAITMLIPAFVFSKMVKLSSDDCFPIKGKLIGGIFLVFAVCQSITITGSAFSDAIYSFMLPDASPMSAGYSVMTDDIYSTILKILSVAVFVPVAEEYIFRGVILTYLKRFGLAFAMVASACLFGVAHASPSQSVYAFVFGLFAAFVTVVTGNIKTAVIFHSANNAITLASQTLSPVIGKEGFENIYCVYVLVTSGLAFFGLYRMVVKDRLFDVFKAREKENDVVATIKPGISQVLTLPLVIYVLYYAFNVVTEVFG